MDLHDLEHNTRDGLHIASLAGAWLALVAGFGGFRDHDGKLAFAPRLPPGIGRLAFRVTVAEGRVFVEVDRDGVSYALEQGRRLALTHFGEALELEAGKAERHAIPPLPPRERPTQPPGREPRRRSVRPGGPDRV
jgi:alpha,alpha-trehalose phosphorylase